MQKIRKLLRLSPSEFLVLIQAALLLPAVRLALHFTRVARLESIRTTPLSFGAGLPAEALARIVKIAAAHGIYHAKCLEESLVLHWFLSNRGIESRILFGTRKENGEVQGHAWVEVNGIPLNDLTAAGERFSPFKPTWTK